MSQTLIILPDDSAATVLEAIAAAKHSLRIKMFAFTDPALLEAVKAAHRRGVHVRVMLNPARRSGEIDNHGAKVTLERSESRSSAAIPHSTSPMRNPWSSTTRMPSSNP